jgi:biopolymer transport protein ExbB/TolQ
MDLNLNEMWHSMPWLVKAVVVALLLQAVASIAVVVDRLILLGRSERASRDFAQTAGPMIERGRIVEALSLASQAAGSHLALFMHTAMATYVKRVGAGDANERAAELARRALDRKAESISDDIHRGMGVLASTGSTAPFVGLLGTVLGILNAFKKIATDGSGGIGTIGGAIGEALIVTGLGLIVAIPAVLIFNWLSTRIASFETGLVNAASEVIDRLEVEDFSDDVPSRDRVSQSADASETRRLVGGTTVAAT